MSEESQYKEPPNIAKLNKTNKTDLYRPLVLPNHQRQFKWFTNLVTLGVAVYMVFYHDFGYEDHCFTSIRQQASKLKTNLLKLDPADKEIVKETKCNTKVD